MQDRTREGWLTTLVNTLRAAFIAVGAPLPARLRIACGWPSGYALYARRRRVGECWAAQDSADGTVEIFISPLLAESLEVAETVVHELVHSAVGLECGHRGLFKRIAQDIGLRGPMQSTYAGPALRDRLNSLIEEDLGPYPHATLYVSKTTRRIESTRLLKVACPACGYRIRVTRRWMTVGCPTCPCGTVMVETR